MDAIEILEEQHRETESLFDSLDEEQGESERRLAFARLADLLVIHMTIEERHFYPEARDKPTIDDLLEAVEEHLAIKRVLADLLDLQVDDPVFEAKLKVLREQVDHHVHEEEEHIFPQARVLCSGAALEAIGAEMEYSIVELAQGEPRRRVRNQTESAPPV
jgi:hypothetical protein